MPCREHTSEALRYGTHSQWISQFYLHTPHSSANGMKQRTGPVNHYTLQRTVHTETVTQKNGELLGDLGKKQALEPTLRCVADCARDYQPPQTHDHRRGKPCTSDQYLVHLKHYKQCNNSRAKVATRNVFYIHGPQLIKLIFVISHLKF